MTDDQQTTDERGWDLADEYRWQLDELRDHNEEAHDAFLLREDTNHDRT